MCVRVRCESEIAQTVNCCESSLGEQYSDERDFQFYMLLYSGLASFRFSVPLLITLATFTFTFTLPYLVQSRIIGLSTIGLRVAASYSYTFRLTFTFTFPSFNPSSLVLYLLTLTRTLVYIRAPKISQRNHDE